MNHPTLLPLHFKQFLNPALPPPRLVPFTTVARLAKSGCSRAVGVAGIEDAYFVFYGADISDRLSQITTLSIRRKILSLF